MLDHTNATVIDQACVRVAANRETAGPDGVIDVEVVRGQLGVVRRLLAQALRD